MEPECYPMLEESIDLSDSDPGDWAYLSEGGATMVFSYTGPPHLVYSTKVLRARKSSDEHGPTHHSDQLLQFNRTIVARLLDPEYLPELLPAHASRDWLSQLADGAEKRRPPERSSGVGLDVTRSNLALATDLVGGRGLAVEIKVCGQ